MARKQKVGGFHTPFASLDGFKAKLAKETAQARAEITRHPRDLAHKPPPPTPARRAPLSDEELFLQEVGGVAPLPKKTTRVASEPQPITTRGKSDEAEVLAQLADLCDGSGQFDISDSDEYIEGLAEGIDRRLLRRLRAGDYAVQAHCDLHGLTREQAKAHVATFLAESRRAGRRCVLIVHGRGLHSKDQVPVLKDALRTWLQRGPAARAVLAFATARPHDGGAGAVYVLLRR